MHRPQTRNPIEPHFNQLLRTFFGHTKHRREVFEKLKAVRAIEPLLRTLQHARLYSLIGSELSAWDDNLWASKDFLSVLQLNEGETDDEYLSPVCWIVRVNADGLQQQQQADTFVLIKLNKLISKFRSNSHHHCVQRKIIGIIIIDQ